MGVLAWSADQTITAFPNFAMVIVDAHGRVVVSDPFTIQSLTRQPALITEGGQVRPTVTGPIKVHVSGTNTLDKMVDAPRKTGAARNGDGKKGKDDDRQKSQGKGNNAKNGENGQREKNNNGGKCSQDQDKAQDNGKDKNNKGKNRGNNGKDKENNDDNGGQQKLLPLPGLPEDGQEAPVSLQPLPNVSAAPTQIEESNTSLAVATSTTESSSTTTSNVESPTASVDEGATKVVEAASPTSGADEPAADAPVHVAQPIEGSTTSTPTTSTTATSSLSDTSTSSEETVPVVGGIILPPTSAAATPTSAPSEVAMSEAAMAEEAAQSLLPLPNPNVRDVAQAALAPTSMSLPGGSFREQPAEMLETPVSLKPLPGVETEVSSLRTLPTLHSDDLSAAPTESPLPANKSSNEPSEAASGRVFPSLVLGYFGMVAGIILNI